MTNLQLPLDRQMSMTKELYKWAPNKKILPNIAVNFLPQVYEETIKTILESHFTNAKYCRNEKMHSQERYSIH